jgi:hypothetical protein
MIQVGHILAHSPALLALAVPALRRFRVRTAD